MVIEGETETKVTEEEGIQEERNFVKIGMNEQLGEHMKRTIKNRDK